MVHLHVGVKAVTKATWVGAADIKTRDLMEQQHLSFEAARKEMREQAMQAREEDVGKKEAEIASLQAQAQERGKGAEERDKQAIRDMMEQKHLSFEAASTDMREQAQAQVTHQERDQGAEERDQRAEEGDEE